jgi:NADH/NAD ratio-sensing transcriptional regulator Rex
MTDSRPVDIPAPSLRRLPLYYRRLMQAVEEGRSSISSRGPGDVANVPDAQVRKDFASCKLNVPADVLVKNEDLAAEPATLSHHIARRELGIDETLGASRTRR